MTENKMIEDKMTVGTIPNGDDLVGTTLEQHRRDWITPQFERIPLSEAMGPILHHVVQDGANLYS